MDQIIDLAEDAGDPRGAIERLEARIEELSDQIESCRKFILASRLAIVLGGALLLAGLFGAIRFDVLNLSAAFAAVLGGIVLLGSNSSTAKQAAALLAAAERGRAALIGLIELRVVSERATLH